MSTLMEKPQKATDACLRQVNILVCVLLSPRKREKLATEKQNQGPGITAVEASWQKSRILIRDSETELIYFTGEARST